MVCGELDCHHVADSRRLPGLCTKHENLVCDVCTAKFSEVIDLNVHKVRCQKEHGQLFWDASQAASAADATARTVYGNCNDDGDDGFRRENTRRCACGKSFANAFGTKKKFKKKITKPLQGSKPFDDTVLSGGWGGFCFLNYADVRTSCDVIHQRSLRAPRLLQTIFRVRQM